MEQKPFYLLYKGKCSQSILAEANGVNKGVLLVDDDKEILYCYRMLLEDEDIDVYSACNAKEAMDILRDLDVDVAILDYMLPNCKGDRLAQLINEEYPDVVIFMVSGIYDVNEAVEKLGIRVKEVFKKPVDPHVLEKIILSECQIA